MDNRTAFPSTLIFLLRNDAYGIRKKMHMYVKLEYGISTELNYIYFLIEAIVWQEKNND